MVYKDFEEINDKFYFEKKNITMLILKKYYSGLVMLTTVLGL